MYRSGNEIFSPNGHATEAGSLKFDACSNGTCKLNEYIATLNRIYLVRGHDINNNVSQPVDNGFLDQFHKRTIP